MPNWCSNRLVVTGKPDDLRVLKEEVQGRFKPISFNNVIPAPSGLYERPIAGLTDFLMQVIGGEAAGEATMDWHSWCCRKWGTKWDVDDEEGFCIREERKRSLLYCFDTAWSPPTPVVAVLARQHPELGFKLYYGERANGFAGKREWRRGEMVKNEEFPPGSSRYRKYCS